jgi:excisionase family DNA binding protein
MSKSGPMRIPNTGDECSTGAAALILKRSQRTIVRYCEDGTLTSIRTDGGHRRIPLVEVHALRDRLADQVAQHLSDLTDGAA